MVSQRSSLLENPGSPGSQGNRSLSRCATAGTTWCPGCYPKLLMLLPQQGLLCRVVASPSPLATVKDGRAEVSLAFGSLCSVLSPTAWVIPLMMLSPEGQLVQPLPRICHLLSPLPAKCKVIQGGLGRHAQDSRNAPSYLSVTQFPYLCLCPCGLMNQTS